MDVYEGPLPLFAPFAPPPPSPPDLPAHTTLTRAPFFFCAPHNRFSQCYDTGFSFSQRFSQWYDMGLVSAMTQALV